MKKCDVCRIEEALWAWQPWGLGEREAFSLLGSHHRGFQVVKVCDDCKESVRAGEPATFVYKMEWVTV